MERLILNIITGDIRIASHQHGYRTNHSTVTHLTTLTEFILNGFNQKRPPERTILVSLDATKAFDKIPRHQLTKKVMNIENLDVNSKRWVTNFITDRISKVSFASAHSKYKSFKNGVPQGGVLSPQLFNFYVSTAPEPPEGILLLSYADDFVIATKSHSIKKAEEKLQDYVNKIGEWFKQIEVDLSPAKSTVTLLTPDNHEYNVHPNITLHDVPLPLEQFPKILGVRLDPKMTFNKHIADICTTVIKKNNALKAITGMNFGQSKEDIIYLYKQFVRTNMNYAASAWAPGLSKTNMQKLQTAQNQSLRTATGCVKMTNVDELHRESKVLKIKDHLDMMGAQTLAKSDMPHHPLSFINDTADPPRNMRETPSRYYRKWLPNQMPTDNKGVRELRKEIHTTIARDSIASLESSKLLDAVPPDIDAKETSLPRKSRVDLARLRTGWHPQLGSYKARTGRAQDPICTRCSQNEADTVPHYLLRCPSFSTIRNNLSITSLSQLWTDTDRIAAYLRETGL